MPHNKKHHFVPRFYLKTFGSNNGKSINIFNIRSNKSIPDGNLKGQCYRNYLYGTDGKIERNLGLIEEQAAKLFRDIIGSRYLPQHFTEQHFVMLSIVLIQWGRTEAAGQSLNRFMDSVFQNAVKDVFAPRAFGHGITREELDKCTMGYEEPERASLSDAAQAIPIALDLAYKILERRSAIEFFTSDNPVLLYNQLAHGRVTGGTTGIGLQGIQIFLPLSSEFMLVFYDSKTYKIGNRKQKFVPISESDVRTLNLLQAINARDNIYFRSHAMLPEVRSTIVLALPKREQSREGFRIAHKSERHELCHWYTKDINHNAKFKFNRMLIKSFVPQHGRVPRRSSRVVAAYNDFMTAFDAAEADFNDISSFFRMLKK